MPKIKYRFVLLPVAISVFAMLLVAAITPLALRAITPAILFPCIYFWAVYRPNLLPIWIIFMLAIINDVLMSLPMGATSLPAILLYILARRKIVRRAFKESFAKLWQYYTWNVSVSLFVLYVILSLYYWHWFNPIPVLGQLLLTILLYPPIYWIFFTLVSNMNLDAIKPK